MSQGWEMMPWHGMIIGPIMMILMLAVVIAVVVLIVRWLGGPPVAHRRAPRTALEILEKRFAKGEIDKDEFEEKKRLLST